MPPLRGARREKPQRPLMAELSPEDAEERRKKQHGYMYDKTSYAKKRSLPPPPKVEGDAAYSRTKTGRKRKDTAVARKRGKARAMNKIDKAFESIGDDAQQAQAYEDWSEGQGRATATAGGYHFDEEVGVAVYEQGQRKRAFERATATAKPRGRVDDDRRKVRCIGDLEAYYVIQRYNAIHRI